MFVLPLGQPAGLSLDSDVPAESSEAGGADFAALMAMAAAFLTPAQTAVSPPAVPVPGTSCSSGETEALPTGAGALLSAFGWAGSGPAPTSGPAAGFPGGSSAAPAASPGSLDALSAAVPVLAPEASGPVSASSTGSPAEEAGEPGLEAIAELVVSSGRQTGPAGGTTGADLPAASEASPAGPAGVPATGLTALAAAEAAGESGTEEESGSKPVAATGTGHDRLSAAHAHPGGALRAAEAGGAADGAAAPVQHPPVADQVVSVVEPLRHRGDGHHELTLDLRPAELGPIRVEVSIERGTVHLSLHADQPSTGTLLHQAMPELRAALEEAGLVAGRLGVGPGDREGGRPPAQPRPAEGDEPKTSRASVTAVTAIRPPVPTAAGALDVLL